MKRHFFLDYAERLFFKAQKALTARDFERAEDLLQQAIATDPEYPHLHMYLGIALGELDRPTEAVSALRKAIELDPKNFVFHMALGIRFLDDGDAAEARRHFQEAARRAPDNLLVKSYVRLASWELGELGVDGLLHDLRDVPIAFRARLLVSLQERAISKAGPAQVLMEGAFDERASETPVRWPWLTRWFGRREIRMALELIESQEYQRAIEVLLSLPNGLESDQVAIKALRKAREAERDRLLQSLEAPERGDSTESPSSRTTVLRIQQRWLKALGREDCLTRSNHLERRMRLELAQVQLDLGQPDAAYGTLERWRNDFIAAERPNREAVEATTALLAMAKVELARADYMQAIRRCAEARGYHPGPDAVCEIARIDALAHLGLGDRRNARFGFEDSLRKELRPIEPVVQRVMRLVMVLAMVASVLGG